MNYQPLAIVTHDLYNSYATIVSVGALTCLSTSRLAKLADFFDIVSLVWLASDSNMLDGIITRF